MVDVNSQSNKVNITVSSSGVSSNVKASGDTSHYYSEKAREWATSNRIVDGVDYSSKYYAEKSNQSALNAQNFAQSAQDSYKQFQQSVDGALSTVNDSVQGAITTIDTTKDTAIDSINSTKTTILNDIEFVADGEKEEIKDLADLIKENAEEIASRTSFAMFDTILKDHILTYEESKGLALQGTWVYKEAIAGSRYGYPDFYNKCLEEYSNSNNTYEILRNNYEVVGSPTITEDGVASGFSVSNYLTIPNYLKGKRNYEIDIEFNLPETLQEYSYIFSEALGTTGLSVYYDRTYVYVRCVSAGVNRFTKSIAKGNYKLKIKYNDGVGTVQYRVNNAEEQTYQLNVSNYVDFQEDILRLSGRNNNGNIDGAFIGGSIDLKQFSITVDGKEVYRAVDYITTNPNGHRFYPISSKTLIDSTYEQLGTAWFYGVDIENERIFLPRNKYFATTGAVVGNGMTVGLLGDNGKTGGLTLVNADHGLTDYAECYGQPIGFDYSSSPVLGATAGHSIGITTDATKSGIVLNPDENKHLYICVGNTVSQSSITDVVEVTTTENDTTPLFTGMHFDFKPNNLSWLKGGEQANNAGIYATCYNELVNVLNGETKYGDLKVVDIADMIVGVDYSEYWKVNQDDMTFTTPTAISNKALSGAVVGNGMTLGLENGNNTYGLLQHGENNTRLGNTLVYGEPLGTSWTSGGASTTFNKSLGITTDPTKSGIIAEQSTAQLYFKVANAVQNLELLDAGKVMEAVADKADADLNNTVASQNFINQSVAWGMPDYGAGLQITINTTGFVAPCDGIVMGHINAGGSTERNILINGINVSHSVNGGQAGMFILNAGDVIKTNAGAMAGPEYFFPLKGVS